MGKAKESRFLSFLRRAWKYITRCIAWFIRVRPNDIDVEESRANVSKKKKEDDNKSACAIEKINRLAQEIDHGKKESNRLAKEKDCSVEERKRLAKEIEHGKEESNRLPQEIDHGKEESNQLAKEKDCSVEERKRLAQEIEHGKEESNQLALEIDNAKQERNQLALEIDNAKQERNQLAKEKDLAMQERIRLDLEMDHVTQERIRLELEMAYVRQERIRLAQEIDRAVQVRIQQEYRRHSFNRADVSPKKKESYKNREEGGPELLNGISCPGKVELSKKFCQCEPQLNIKSRKAIQAAPKELQTPKEAERSNVRPVEREMVVLWPSSETSQSNSSKSEERVTGTRPVKETPATEFSLESFDFLKILGTGTFGKVFLAQEKKSRVAIKAIKKCNKRKEYHITERNILKISHKCPYLIHGLGNFDTEHCLFYVMELAARGNLGDFISKNYPLEVKTTKFIMAELVCGLQFLHDHRIIHRDLKPENILVMTEGHIKIGDFGLCVMGVDMIKRRCHGTPAYAAPEMVLGNPYGPAVDYFSLGAILYVMCTKRLAFPNGNIKTGNDRQPNYPFYIHNVCRDFLRGLLEKEAHKRLSGKDEVRRHAFFHCVNWEDVDNFRLQPPAQMQRTDEVPGLAF